MRFVRRDVDRHGNVRLYFQRHRRGPKVRIDAEEGTPEFYAQYQALLAGEHKPPASSGIAPGTWRWLCIEYFRWMETARLDPQTRRTRRAILDSTFVEPVHPEATETFAAFPLARLTTKALGVLRDRKAQTPHAANNRVKAIRAVFKWAVKQEHVRVNPARELDRIDAASTGWHSWDVDEVRRFEERHPIGTKARLALALLIYTGVRRSDVVLLGRQHRQMVPNPDNGVPEPWLKFVQRKNRRRKPVTIEIPVLPELDRVIEASPAGEMTYLVTEYGLPFSAAGFGGKMRQWCNEAGLPECSSHGLRKAGAATAAENGATPHQLMSIFGWLTIAEAERYTRAARRRKMAGEAMGLLVRNKNGKSPT